MLLLPSIVCSEIPHVINYQGRLTNDDGVPLNGEYNMQFTIYNQCPDGDVLWQEQHLDVEGNSVVVDNGLFNVLLGEIDPLPVDVFDSPDRCLGIKIGSDEEIIPTTKFTSVPFAYRSLSSDSDDDIQFKRIGFDNTHDCTNMQTYEHVGNTIAIGSNVVQSYIIVILRLSATIPFRSEIRQAFVDIRIGESGLESSKEQEMFYDFYNYNSLTIWHTIVSTIEFYYEPSQSEKENGFNVIVFMKVNGIPDPYTEQACIKKIEIFGM
jgi:hypothetical protein